MKNLEQRLERIENAITGLLDLVKRHDSEIREIKAHLSI
jgi:chaperonin cofactor prefoldin